MSLVENKKFTDKAVANAQLLFNSGLYDECCYYISKVANFCWLSFSGYYTAYRLEKILQNISVKTLNPSIQKKSTTEGKKLHIFSELYDVGGHTRLMLNWIKKDQKSRHSILSTRQGAEKVETILKSLNFQENIEEKFYLEGSFIEKSKKLLDIVLRENYDQIILHIHPDDIIPVLALSHPSASTPVLFLNHAEHTFWLGASVLDLLIQIKKENIETDSERRSIEKESQFLLPIPVKSDVLPKVKNDNVVLLSIGSEYKYTPRFGYNFFKEVHSVLSRFENVVCYLVGVPADNQFYKEYEHPRLICVGPQKNIDYYHQIADIYLEGFPFASFTAMLETSLQKVPFVLQYSPEDNMILFTDENIDFIKYPKDVDEWHTQLNKLITNADYRKSLQKQQYEYVYAQYSEESWLNYLKDIDDKAKTINHTVLFHDDKFFQGEEEKKLLKYHPTKFYYFDGLENLPIIKKIALALGFPKSNGHMHKYNLKETVYFILNKK